MKIKHGTTRTVFIFNKFVIKIPSIFRFIHIKKDMLNSEKKSIGLLKNFIKYGLSEFRQGLIANRTEVRISKKYKPSFYAKMYFNISNIILVSERIFGTSGTDKELSFIAENFLNIDPDYKQKVMNKFYKLHDVYTEDWLKTKKGFICVDYGGNFAELLAKNKILVEQKLKKIN